MLTRHWRDTPRGTEVELWLATDSGPQKVRLPLQESVAFIPAEQRVQAERLLADEKMSVCANYRCRISIPDRFSACIARNTGS